MGNKFIKQLKTNEVVLSFKQRNDLKLCATVLFQRYFLCKFKIRRFTTWADSASVKKKWGICHCVKSVQIRSSFWSVYSRIRTESFNLRIQFGYRKIRTRKNSYLDTFHAVVISLTAK